MSGDARRSARARGRALRWGLVLAYMAVLFAASAVPNPPPLPGQPSDKFVHTTLYAGLGVVSVRALTDGLWMGITVVRLVGAVTIATGYGAFDEFHQSFVAGRDSAWGDLVADGLGGFLGAAGWWGWGILAGERRKP